MATYAKSERTKKRLFEVACELFLTRGYSATSLRDIAQAAQVSTGTLYRYYPLKSDFLFQIRRNALDHVRCVANALPDEASLFDKIKILVGEDVGYMEAEVGFAQGSAPSDPLLELALATRCESFASLDQMRCSEELRAELRTIYEQVILSEQRNGRLDPEVVAADLAAAIAALYYQTIDLMVLSPNLDPVVSISPRLALLLRGLDGNP